MADDVHLRKLKGGAAAWRKWLPTDPRFQADLTGADLTGVDLKGANLSGADLTRTSLRFADLAGANLANANLSGANFTGADLTQDQLNSACIRKGGKPPTLSKGLKPPQKVCRPMTRGHGHDDEAA